MITFALASLVAPYAALPPAVRMPAFDTVEATVGWSEWCPPGHVALELQTGRYRLVPPAPRRTCAGRPRRREERGTLPFDAMEAIREVVAAVETQGLQDEACRRGGPPPHAVISNAAGPYTLVVSGPGRRVDASPELGCWTPAAVALQRNLEQYLLARRPED